MKKIKTIKKVINSLPSRVGTMHIEQALPTREVSYIDPFLLIHHAKFSVPEGTKEEDAGVGPHPHKGFSPVTFVFEGSVHHRDSKGNDAVVHAGGTQWMHSGNGIIHSERPDKELSHKGGNCEFIQFWVNSKSSDKKEEAFYKPISKDDIPKIHKDRVTISVDAGEYEGKNGPAPILSPQKLLRLDIKTDAKFSLDIPATYNSLIYVLNGELQVNGNCVKAKQMVEFNNDGTDIQIAASIDSMAILLSGEPIGEPMFSHGPFVMNTEDEIREAILESENGKMGELIENFLRISHMKEMWDKRYSSDEYVYGIEPNDFFAEQLKGLKNGKILLPAEGEGRNAVFAAKLDWEVFAFDISKEAKTKAEKLAESNDVSIKYEVGELPDIKLQESSFDAIGLIYAHFTADKKTLYHKKLDKLLKPGGIVILEGFNKSQIETNSKNEKPMGPRDNKMLFSYEEIKNDFSNYRILELKEEEITLKEGGAHKGFGSVVRFVGVKL